MGGSQQWVTVSYPFLATWSPGVHEELCLGSFDSLATTRSCEGTLSQGRASLVTACLQRAIQRMRNTSREHVSSPTVRDSEVCATQPWAIDNCHTMCQSKGEDRRWSYSGGQVYHELEMIVAATIAVLLGGRGSLVILRCERTLREACSSRVENHISETNGT